MRFRQHDSHSYHAKSRLDDVGTAFVTVVDRYYPGPPGPEYSTVLYLAPHEAHDLGKQLMEAAREASRQQEARLIQHAVAAQVRATAEAAKVEAEA